MYTICRRTACSARSLYKLIYMWLLLIISFVLVSKICIYTSFPLHVRGAPVRTWQGFLINRVKANPFRHLGLNFLAVDCVGHSYGLNLTWSLMIYNVTHFSEDNSEENVWPHTLSRTSGLTLDENSVCLLLFTVEVLLEACLLEIFNMPHWHLTFPMWKKTHNYNLTSPQPFCASTLTLSWPW